MTHTSRIVNTLMLVVGFAFLYFPIAMVIIFSFSESRTPGVWGGFSLTWYHALFQDRSILDALWVSLRIALQSATLALVLGTTGAFILVRFGRFKGRDLFASLVNVPVLLPDIILGLGLVLLFVQMNAWLGWPQALGMHTVITAHATVGMAYVLIIVRGRLLEVDAHLEEAALDLGATPTTVFWKITLPVIASSLLSGWLLAFTLSLDDVILASFLTGPGATTLSVEVFSQIRTGVTPKINAVATLLIAVIAFLASIASVALFRKRP
ncbi:MAG: ABC transporter permease subunit [Alphaproteobacteria bacterium]|nr:MAG: ABC transporter permease subunit [Alphaproteobacteria bacterium]